MPNIKITDMIYIGIDPGSTTGYAFWDSHAKYLEVKQFKSHSEAVLNVDSDIQFFRVSENDTTNIKVIIEDARKTKARPDLAKANAGKLQGVGYVKAYSKDWEAFCKLLGVEYELRPPGKTKTSPEYFEQLTGLKTKKTESHMRDAALLVYGR